MHNKVILLIYSGILFNFMLTFKSGNLLEDSDKIEVIFEESFRAIYSEI